MGSKAVLIEAPIKGVFDKEINVNDEVMVVTTGYSHRASIRKGKYKGYIEGTGYYKKRARIEIEGSKTAWFKPDGTEFDWRTDYNSTTWKDVQPTLTTKTIPHTYETTLNLNRIATLKD